MAKDPRNMLIIMFFAGMFIEICLSLIFTVKEDLKRLFALPVAPVFLYWLSAR